MINDQLRAKVVSEARSWIGTPYHHMGAGLQVPGRQLKGIGIDCAQILVEVYAACDVIEWFDTGKYPADFMMHSDDPTYIDLIIPRAEEYDWRVEPILPADLPVWLFGRTYSHGGIVTEWPKVVHAYAPYGFVDESDVTQGSHLSLIGHRKPRPMRMFRMK
jgi:hypothetical protein